MVKAPIVPRHFVAGLDIAGATLTLEDVQAALCAGTSHGDDGQGYAYSGWGDHDELVLGYKSTAPHAVHFVQINEGYKGEVRFVSRPDSRFGPHLYSIAAGRPVLRDGVVFDMRWNGSNEAATELYDALMFTYAPSEPGDDVDCRASGRCLFIRDSGDNPGGIFGARPLNFYFRVSNTDAPPAGSTPEYLYMFVRP